MNAPRSRKGRKEAITFFKNTANMNSLASALSPEPLSPRGTHALLFHRVNLRCE
jgi:hypothetical protein